MKLALSDSVAWDVELYNSWLAGWNGKAIAQLARLASAAGTCEQDLSQHPVTTAVISTGQSKTATQNNTAIRPPCLNHLDIEHRKPDKGQRLGNMLVAQNCKTVICGHEQIVAGDV